MRALRGRKLGSRFTRPWHQAKHSWVYAWASKLLFDTSDEDGGVELPRSLPGDVTAPRRTQSTPMVEPTCRSNTITSGP